MITVEVAYAEPDCQVVVPIELTSGAVVEDAICASGLLSRFPAIELGVNALGIWGVQCALDTVLSAGDRVEVYRPLLKDPKQQRRDRVTPDRSRRSVR